MKIKERIIEELGQNKKLTLVDLRNKLKITKYEKKDFNKNIKQMNEEGTISVDRNGYLRLGSSKTMKGIFSETKYDYGFVKTSDGVDYFIPGNGNNGATDGDEVLISQIERGEGRTVAHVVKILNKSDKYVVCHINIVKNKYQLIPPKDFPYPIMISDFPKGMKLKDGKYKVKLNKFNKKKKFYTGEVVEYVCPNGDIYTDLKTLVSEYDLPLVFPKDVIKYANEVAKEDIILGKRVDYRDLFTVTIDGDDAKDFDDAISVVKNTDDSYDLYVHIADVSNYVKDGTPVDTEAKRRYFSIYLPGLTIPMLPEALSNGVCSLNPNEDRYTISAHIKLEKNHLPKLISLDKAMINSDHRLTYNGVNMLFTEGSNDDYDEKTKSFLYDALEVYKILKKQAHERGTINFLSDEPKFILDNSNQVIDIIKNPHIEGESIIEEMMIITNKLVANKFLQMDVPFIYRIHESPSDEKLESMKTLLRPFGIRVPDHLSVKTIQEILEAEEKQPSFERINDIILRSMMKAEYSEENIGHFALALENYSHFTSPIRRYPDLFIHRVISQIIKGELSKKSMSYFRESAKNIASNSTMREKKIVELEREADQMKKCEYMKKHLYEEFDGKVSGMTEFGIFVKLENTVEGLVCDDEFMSGYEFDEKYMTARRLNDNKAYEIGTPVRVKVINVNLTRLEIDFKLMEDK